MKVSSDNDLELKNIKSENLYLPLHNILDKKGNSYCVDMLRFKAMISYRFFRDRVENHLLLYGDKCIQYQSSKMGEFRYNYRISDILGNSFWIGYMSNKELSDHGLQSNDLARYNLTIEFNPNKTYGCKFIKSLLSIRYDHYTNKSIKWEIISCDFAFDIKTNILNIGGIEKGNKRQLMIYDNGKDNKTYYLGKGKNRVKIYNKKIESDLSEDLTRIELSYKFKSDFNVLDVYSLKDLDLKAFPNLYIKEYQINFYDLEELEKDKTLKVIMFAVNHGYPIKDLSRVYKDKVNEFIKRKEPIDIDSKLFISALHNYIDFYFRSEYIIHSHK